jgi:predicted nucleic acid-binding protein
MTVRAFLDTNVLVYAFDARDERKQSIGQQVLDDDEIVPVLSIQVLGEFYVTISRKLPTPLSQADAEAAVSAFSRYNTVAIDAQMVRAAIAASVQHQLSYWDALILESAVAGGCTQLITEDLDHGSVLRGIEIVNPFAA